MTYGARLTLMCASAAVGSLMIMTSSWAESLHIGSFSSTGLDGWEEHEFKNRTQYQLQQSDGQQIIKAQSSNAASGLFKSITVDLNRTPYLNWRWRVDKVLNGVDEQSKEGDDYPARIYVVKEGFFPWSTKAVNYVWSSNQPTGTRWHNVYTGNARMIALQSGDRQSGQWITEKRNVKEDFKALFGDEFDKITTVALMTDTDNSGQQATAYYGDIYFSAD
ncbi:MAG: DUF3047 domain-containing protein [Chromatiales bacterium]|nr:DUF3047 domain-containing protein [Chromatiales bacterium]